jgi:sphingomyelin phosphodiesterase acid-like 3
LRLRIFLCLWLAAGSLLLAVSVGAQSGRAAAPGKDDGLVPALLLSDIHFDPFHDPERVKRLDQAPASEWASILAAPESANAAQAFSSLQKICRAKGVDTPYPLLRASLDAMRSREAAPGFVTVTGDLIAHQFTCRYQTLFPGVSQQSYEAFVEKTIQFVVEQLRGAFPGTPVYVSLGNNDSDCGDYRLDAGGGFLSKTAELVAEGLPVGSRRDVLREFPAGGYYSVAMEPLRRARVIVLNDIYWSPKYATCKGAADPAPGITEMEWLEKQFNEARAAGQKVWVMGHIPPGVNVYSTVTKLKDVCANEPAEMFLNSERLDDILTRNADVVRLGLFAHTHMDEMRVIGPAGADGVFGGGASGAHEVAAKMVPSISPVDGNDPSFTVARVDRATGVLKDYAVVVASDFAGSAWREEYDFGATYHAAAYSPETVEELITGFRADRKAQQMASQEYIRHYFKGDAARELAPFWGQYACSLDELTGRGYAACICAAYK